MKQACVIAPIDLAGPGEAAIPNSLPPAFESAEGARDASGPKDPRASTPRDIEACRVR